MAIHSATERFTEQSEKMN